MQPVNHERLGLLVGHPSGLSRLVLEERIPGCLEVPDDRVAVIHQLDAGRRTIVQSADHLHELCDHPIIDVPVPLGGLDAGAVVVDIDAGRVRLGLPLLVRRLDPAGRVHGQEVRHVLARLLPDLQVAIGIGADLGQAVADHGIPDQDRILAAGLEVVTEQPPEDVGSLGQERFLDRGRILLAEDLETPVALVLDCPGPPMHLLERQAEPLHQPQGLGLLPGHRFLVEHLAVQLDLEPFPLPIGIEGLGVALMDEPRDEH